MVLYPLPFESEVCQSPSTVAVPGAVPVWDAIQRKQKQRAQSWWLIAQPDHAALAGDVAALLDAPGLPQLGADVLRAITLHDAGWARFDGGVRGTGNELQISLRDPKLSPEGRPLSFLDMNPVEFLLAWKESIAQAALTGSIGGVIVSQHFSRIGKARLQAGGDNPEDTSRLEQFLRLESERQHELLAKGHHVVDEVMMLVDILQFCDLLSLYLCCGAQDDVEFPQSFAGQRVRLRTEGRSFLTEPRLISTGVRLEVTARKHAGHDCVEVGKLVFLPE
jgi:hypothetical protein